MRAPHRAEGIPPAEAGTTKQHFATTDEGGPAAALGFCGEPYRIVQTHRPREVSESRKYRICRIRPLLHGDYCSQ
jgi:hypothetical protein